MKCWFCNKGRHEDCMRVIPQEAVIPKGINKDCSFDIINEPCECMKNNHK